MKTFIGNLQREEKKPDCNKKTRELINFGLKAQKSNNYVYICCIRFSCVNAMSVIF